MEEITKTRGHGCECSLVLNIITYIIKGRLVVNILPILLKEDCEYITYITNGRICVNILPEPLVEL